MHVFYHEWPFVIIQPHWSLTPSKSVTSACRRSTWDYARERGFAAEYLDSLLNLELALECNGWIGTLSSNWCRLIDELRWAWPQIDLQV